jgi:hypothetical protein
MVHTSSQELLEKVPYGLVMTRAWLLAQGVSPHTVDNWRKSKRLEPIAQGVFKQPGVVLTWEGIVCSLQRMGVQLAPGGLTALSRYGLSHYLMLSTTQQVGLYGPEPLPTWVNHSLINTEFRAHKGLPLDETCRSLPTNIVGQEMKVATPERAILELLMDVPDQISFEHADEIFLGLTTLSPRRLQNLLERWPNVKAKRLFLWFAERHQHPWLQKLEWQHLTMASGSLGQGKRVLVKGGKLDQKYLITVPQELHV